MLDLALYAAIVVAVVILASAIKIVREYERSVIFRLGRLLGIKGPGIFLIIPIIDSMIKVDLRTRVIDVMKQRVITRDNVTVDVDAVVYYRVFDPEKAIVQVENYKAATSLLAQTTLRDVLGQVELDSLLSEREKLNKQLQSILDAATDAWGIKVSAVTIKDVALPEEMLRAIAKQAEAEREKRSRIIVAEGELLASKKMTEAASFYQKIPAALKLRELQTLAEVAREKNLIVVPSTAFGAIAGLTKAMQVSGKKEKPVEKKRVERVRKEEAGEEEEIPFEFPF
ncbi:MAG: slipin family protein [Candidatus Aenigmarchaeota archaeon]|nr:slipin family protein [Candidatus Aenigmarchaeota archaeon]